MFTRILLACGLICAAGLVCGAELVLDAPAGGEIFVIGQTQYVRLSERSRFRTVRIELSRDGGTTWTDLATLDARTLRTTGNTFQFTVSGPISNQCVVRATGTRSAGNVVGLSGSFAISDAVPIPVSGAAGGDLTGTFPNPQIAPNAVTTPKVVDRAVTSNKIGSGAASPNFLLATDGTGGANWISPQGLFTPGGIAAEQLADGSVTAGKINSLPAAAGYVLTADGLGGASWKPLPATNKSIGQSVTVGATGADFTSVQAAIDSITDASLAKPYVILVYPGIYNESIVCKDYVHIFGFGSVEYGVTGAAIQSNNNVVTSANCNISNMRFNLLPGGTGNGASQSIRLVNGQNGQSLRAAFNNCYFVVNGDYGANTVKLCEQNGNADIYFENCSAYYRPVTTVASICFDAVNGTINATNLYMDHYLPATPPGIANLIFWRKGVNSGPNNSPDELQLVYFREFPKLAAQTLFQNDDTQAILLVNGLFGIPRSAFPGLYTAGPGIVMIEGAADTPVPAPMLATTTTSTANYTAAVGDFTIRMDATAGPLTVSLPAAANVPGQVFKIKKIDASGNSVTIKASGIETIDGTNTKSITTQYGIISVQSNGTSWDVI